MLEDYMIEGSILIKDVFDKEDANRIMTILGNFLIRKLNDLENYYYYAIKNDIIVWGIVNEIDLLPSFPRVEPENLTMYGWFLSRDDHPEYKWIYDKASKTIVVEFTFYKK